LASKNNPNGTTYIREMFKYHGSNDTSQFPEHQKHDRLMYNLYAALKDKYIIEPENLYG
jgi:hypothetical protein